MRKWLELDAVWSQRLSLDDAPPWLHRVAAILAHSGDSWLWIAGLVLLFVVGDVFWQAWAIIMGAAIFVLAGLVLGIKFTVRRQRPQSDWGDIYRKTDPHSFPSGHAARSALIATLAVFMGPTWLAIPLLIWAPLVSLARVALGVHYLSDVIVGSIIGILAGLITRIVVPL